MKLLALLGPYCIVLGILIWARTSVAWGVFLTLLGAALTFMTLGPRKIGSLF